MKALIWSFTERLFPRVASAAIMLALAFFVDPAVVGVYSLAILALTLYQSATDNAIRQIAVLAITTKAGKEFIRRYQFYSAALGMVFFAGFLFLLYTFAESQSREQVHLLIPLMAVPLITAWRVNAVALLQTTSQWRALASAQFISSACSFAISIPVLISTRSILACALQLTVTELVFSVSTRRLAARTKTPQVVDSEESPRREFAHLSLYSILGWFQGQADRLLLAPIAGATQLGLYSMSMSISRSGGDAISMSTANVLRPALLQADTLDVVEVRNRADHVLIKALKLSTLAVVATVLASELVLRPMLSPAWDPALDAVPVMTLAVVPTLLSWSLTVILLATNRIRWAAPIKAMGILLALPIAIAAAHSLVLASWLVLVREVVVAALLAATAGPARPRSALIAGTLSLTMLAIGALVVLHL